MKVQLRKLKNFWHIASAHIMGTYILHTNNLNTLMSSLNQTVRDKTNGAHVILRGNFSGPVSTIDLVKSSKGSASLVVYTRKKFWLGDCGFL